MPWNFASLPTSTNILQRYLRWQAYLSGTGSATFVAQAMGRRKGS